MPTFLGYIYLIRIRIGSRLTYLKWTRLSKKTKKTLQKQWCECIVKLSSFLNNIQNLILCFGWCLRTQPLCFILALCLFIHENVNIGLKLYGKHKPNAHANMYTCAVQNIMNTKWLSGAGSLRRPFNKSWAALLKSCAFYLKTHDAAI